MVKTKGTRMMEEGRRAPDTLLRRRSQTALGIDKADVRDDLSITTDDPLFAAV